MMRLRMSLIFVMLLGGAHTLTADILYSVRDLGDLTGGFFGETYGYGINNAGQVTGSSLTRGSVTHAFLYSNGTMQDLGTLPLGNPDTVGHSINNAGQVTGDASVSFGGEFGTTTYFTAFLYSNGQMMGLFPPAPPDSHGYGINDAGQVTGSYTSMGSIHAFLYNNGQITDLGSGSEGRGINNAGQVTGASNGHAFLYTNGQLNDLGTLNGVGNSIGRGINDRGQVTGDSTASTGFTHAFLYSNGQMTDLGTLPGAIYSFGSAINNAGQVVGTSSSPTGFRHAFLYSNGQLSDLNSLIDPALGLTLLSADGINDNGQIVANSSINGRDHAYLLTPVPEPRTWALLGSGGLVIAGMFRRRKMAQLN